MVLNPEVKLYELVRVRCQLVIDRGWGEIDWWRDRFQELDDCSPDRAYEILGMAETQIRTYSGADHEFRQLTPDEQQEVLRGLTTYSHRLMVEMCASVEQ